MYILGEHNLRIVYITISCMVIMEKNRHEVEDKILGYIPEWKHSMRGKNPTLLGDMNGYLPHDERG